MKCYFQQLPLHLTLVWRSQDIKFHAICYDGHFSLDQCSLLHFWDTLHISLTTSDPNRLAVYYGNSSQMLLSSRSYPRKASDPIHLSPYEVSCVGIKHSKESLDEIMYSLDAKFHMWPGYPLILALGLIMIFTAPTLSRLARVFV